jgi:hypothetical protein
MGMGFQYQFVCQKEFLDCMLDGFKAKSCIQIGYAASYTNEGFSLM